MATSKNLTSILIRKKGPKGLAKNIEARLNDAYAYSPDLAATGLNWYVEGREIAKSATGLDAIKACGIVAALSPQTSWAENIKNAGKLVKTDKAPSFSNNVNKARRIRDGESPFEVLSGKKVVAFFNNLYKPHETEYITIDRHAVNIALGDIVGGSDRALELVGNYDTVAEAYKIAAKKFDILPNQAQAITWIIWRTINAPWHAAQDSEISA